MTSGTAKVFRSGNGWAIFISKHTILEEKIEPGHIVEYTIRKCNIPKTHSGLPFQKKIKEPADGWRLSKTIKDEPLPVKPEVKETVKEEVKEPGTVETVTV